MNRRRRGRAAASEPTATFQVRFSRRPLGVASTAPPEPAVRLPRVTRLLVLAHRIGGMIRAGEIRNWAEAARMAGVTRARMTQIANLTLLSPTIQDAILATSPTVWTECNLRRICNLPAWKRQERIFLDPPCPAYD